MPDLGLFSSYIQSLLGEPVNYPSNVAGGLGWFTLHFPDVRVIRVE